MSTVATVGVALCIILAAYVALAWALVAGMTVADRVRIWRWRREVRR